ncbi:MAG: polysaccharide pyruvyl transferase family protein [Parabacteroides sp.]|nr:polysaccharide pyruvyl transferase family protein [Parabacteroides sp.]
MKIAILTLRLHTNYGGILQAYALMQVLKKLGHEPWLIYNQPFKYRYWFSELSLYISNAFKKYILGHRTLEIFREKRIRKEYETIYVNTLQFVERYMLPRTEIICTSEEWRQLQKKYQFEAYVVGSDQVWRPAYANPISRYFFSFLKEEKEIKRLSYAASFGVEEWTFSDKETQECRKLIQLFDAVSFREESGIVLCERNLGRGGVHLLDPTMLLNKEDYLSLIPIEEKQKFKDGLFVYILDPSEWKLKVVEEVEQVYKLSSFSVNKEVMAAPVEDWLNAFDSAEYIVTDSFHACVFSILFHKPFWVCGNKDRGMARFHSLLSLFGLENRLIEPNNSFDQIEQPIDWNKVDIQLEKLRKKSFSFLNENLKE